MARFLTHSPRWMLGRGWILCLALLCCGCFSPQTPPSRPSAPASIEQTASDATSAQADCPTRLHQMERLGLPRWHALGFRGQGVKIAILDSGFRGYRAFLGKGLPQAVRTKSFRLDHDLEARDSQHGILCAEVVHALAPEAELLFAGWEPDSPHSFLDAVRWARAEGARVVSCSLIMPGWSDGEGGGETHRALSKLLGPGLAPHDLLCFASAGNTALRHWSGDFTPEP
jgi:hypothetical protein